jgi:hypothetical protein
MPSAGFPSHPSSVPAPSPRCRVSPRPARCPRAAGSCAWCACSREPSCHGWCASGVVATPLPRPVGQRSRCVCARRPSNSAPPTSSSGRSSPAARACSHPNWCTSSRSAAIRCRRNRSTPCGSWWKPISAPVWKTCSRPSIAHRSPLPPSHRCMRPRCSPVKRSWSRCSGPASMAWYAKICASWRGWRRSWSVASPSPRWPTRLPWSNCSPRPSWKSSTSGWKRPT